MIIITDHRGKHNRRYSYGSFVEVTPNGSVPVKTKNKTVGVARQQRVIFFVATKPTGSILESEAKESLALRWACLAQG
jgi:hypothetical protein